MAEDENLQHIFEVDVPTLFDSLPEILTKEVNNDEEERSSDGVSRIFNVNDFIDSELDLSYDQKTEFSNEDEEETEDYFDPDFENSVLEETSTQKINEEIERAETTAKMLETKPRTYKDSSVFRQRFSPPKGLQVQEGRRSRRA